MFAVLSFLVLSGCTEVKEPATTEVASISISPSSLIVAGIGSSYQLTVGGQLTNGAEVGDFTDVVWSSSNNSLATVDANGLVTVYGKGQLTITATYLNLTDAVTVKVVEVASLAMFPANVTVTALNETFSLNVVATSPANELIAGFNGAEWLSSNPAIASVDAFGSITTHAVGAVVITATYESNSAESNVVIDNSEGVIKGVASYEDRFYDSTGFTGYGYKAIRYATIELLDENNEVFISTATDENGAYSLGRVVPDTYSIRLLAQVKSAPAAGFKVVDMQGAIYTYTKSSAENTLTYDFRLGRTLSGVGAFNLLDVTTVSAEYATQVLGLTAENLTIYWEKNYGLDGTYYCTGYDQYSCFNDKGIYIISQPSTSLSVNSHDTDEFDDDVIMHEFGHFLTTIYSVDDSPGGRHTITQNDSDLRLSWSEGWGLFFPTAVKSWLQSSRPLLMSFPSGVPFYIDTVGNAAALSHNIAYGEMGDGYYYASSEAAVARILWNVRETFGMPKIWDVLENYFPVSGKPTSLPVFWDGLLASNLYSAGDLSTLESIFEDRRVIYQVDDAEIDDTLSNASYQAVDTIPNVANTLYSDELVDDVDYISFDAVGGQTYIISTTALYNGIDTLIQLYNPDGFLIATNDDAVIGAHEQPDNLLGVVRVRNNTTAMASEIYLPQALSGRYVVAVKYANKTNPEYDFVGHYGSYKLVIRSQ